MKTTKLYTDTSGWVRDFETKELAFEYFSGLKEKYMYIKFAESIEDVKEVYTPFNAKKCIHDGETFSEYCSDLLDNWLEDISKDNRYIRPVN